MQHSHGPLDAFLRYVLAISTGKDLSNEYRIQTCENRLNISNLVKNAVNSAGTTIKPVGCIEPKNKVFTPLTKGFFYINPLISDMDYPEH